MGEQALSPQELAALLQRLDALIEEARALQQEIANRLRTTYRQDQQDRTGQPERRRRPRAKKPDR